MNTFQTIALVLAGLSMLMWLLELLASIITLKTLPRVAEMPDSPIPSPPMVSVIIAACNEAEYLDHAMTLRLQEDYPNIEFILIDDRSRDNTRELIQRIAASDKRVKPVYIDELPDGWLGKVHAMHRGIRQAAGEWFLFSDADVFVKPGTLNRLMHYCRANKRGHLMVVPEFYSTGNLIVDAAVAVFLKALMVVGRTWKIKDPNSRAFGGAGAFSLVKRSAYDKTKGFEWMKIEVADDLTLAQSVKRSGIRCDAVSARGFVGVHWYTSLKEMWRGMGRALYVGVGNYSFIRLAFLASIGLILDMMPYLLLIPVGVSWFPAAGIGLIFLALVTAVVAGRIINMPPLPCLLLPLGNLITFSISISAGIYWSIKGGITWRGTFYSRKELKSGSRLTY